MAEQDGFTAVGHAILEALGRTFLYPNESKIVHVVMRKTYGWHKKDDYISLTQLSSLTGIKKPHVCRSMNSLVKRKILTRGTNKRVCLNREYQQWQ